jgi:hypothetical protein
MSHRNARLTPAGRRIIIERVLSGRPVAKELGVSRTLAHRWLNRYRTHGWAGLEDRHSRPKSCPHATPAAVAADVLAQRLKHRGKVRWIWAAGTGSASGPCPGFWPVPVCRGCGIWIRSPVHASAHPGGRTPATNALRPVT